MATNCTLFFKCTPNPNIKFENGICPKISISNITFHSKQSSLTLMNALNKRQVYLI